jgi:hypothetical protein
MALCSLKTAILRTDSSSAPRRATSSETFTLSMPTALSWRGAEYGVEIQGLRAHHSYRAAHAIVCLCFQEEEEICSGQRATERALVTLLESRRRRWTRKWQLART